MQTVTELVTGNYTIIRLANSGDDFLQAYGGNLRDNLEGGHRLACELFPEHYATDFLDKISVTAYKDGYPIHDVLLTPRVLVSASVYAYVSHLVNSPKKPHVTVMLSCLSRPRLSGRTDSRVLV